MYSICRTLLKSASAIGDHINPDGAAKASVTASMPDDDFAITICSSPDIITNLLSIAHSIDRGTWDATAAEIAQAAAVSIRGGKMDENIVQSMLRSMVIAMGIADTVMKRNAASTPHAVGEDNPNEQVAMRLIESVFKDD